jgi:hypothetical protein
LTEELLAPESQVHADIMNLLHRKKSGVELDLEPKLTAVHDFLNEKIGYYEQVAGSLPAGSEVDKEDLSVMFRDTLREVWGDRF